MTAGSTGRVRKEQKNGKRGRATSFFEYNKNVGMFATNVNCLG